MYISITNKKNKYVFIKVWTSIKFVATLQWKKILCNNNTVEYCLGSVYNIVYKYICMYSYSQKYFAFLKCINFKEKMLHEGIILKYFSYILINITRGIQK